jgi:hypothetical protein
VNSLRRRVAIRGIFCAAVFLTCELALADFAAGEQAFKKGDFATAAREWRVAADQGDAAAQYRLSQLYFNGWGVPRDEQAGRKWQWLAAKSGNTEAQRVLDWPFKPDDLPYLTCTPYPPSKPQQGEGDQPVKADSIKGFRFEITLHNARRALESPAVSIYNGPSKETNVEVSVYRIENGHRVEMAHLLWGWGGGSTSSAREFDIRDESLGVGVRIPVDEAERRLYIEQFLAVLAGNPGVPAEGVQRMRQMMLAAHSDSEPSYFDNLMPNRLGAYEIVCRYQSRKPDYWPGVLEAPPLRFDYVRTMDWIETFKRKEPQK